MTEGALIAKGSHLILLAASSSEFCLFYYNATPRDRPPKNTNPMN
jgi:hypothetical protein